LDERVTGCVEMFVGVLVLRAIAEWNDTPSFVTSMIIGMDTVGRLSLGP